MSEPTSRSSQSPNQILEEALVLHQQGVLDGAEALYKEVLVSLPTDFTAVHQLGVLRNQQGDFEAGAQLLGQAVGLHPRSALAHFNLGIALWNLGRAEEALSEYQYSLVIKPDNADVLLNYGKALRELHRPEEALARLTKLVRIEPGRAEAHLQLGLTFQELGQFEEALGSFGHALQIISDHEEALLYGGDALMALGRPQEALRWLDRVLAFAPSSTNALINRGNVLQALGRSEEALDSYDRVLSQIPDHALALGNRSPALLGVGRAKEALESCDRALALNPLDANAWGNRGAVLLALKRYPDALESLDRSLELFPQHPEVLLNQGSTLYNLGRHAEAIISYEKALALQPTLAAAHSNLIFLLDYVSESGVVEQQAARRTYFKTQVEPWARPIQPYSNDRDPERPLVLGYVSSDFRDHSAASCFAPVLKHHHRSKFKFICYSGVKVEDEWTRAFKSWADVWRETALLSDEEMAAQIRADAVDILIDLSGHSAGNRLLVFGRKPAPIQVTAWGHGGGTGLPMVDYQFTDPVMVPEAFRPLFAETSYDLPCSLPFEAPAYAPLVSELPAHRNGLVTFGSLNKFAKVTPEALEVWARILVAIPQSQLLLKDGPFETLEVRRKVLDRFASHGIDPDRLELRGHTSHAQHLAAYQHVDIALDTFPQNGGLTTWEALWMGVPVIAKLGNQPSSRLSGGILHAVGMGDWVGPDEEAYVALAVQKAGGVEALALLRQGLRQQITASAAGNSERYVQAVEEGYRAMWKRWLDQ